MKISKRSLIFSILLLGILGIAEVASTKRGKGRRFQQRPLAAAYHNAAFQVAQPQIPSYHNVPSGYPTPPALRQPVVRPIAPRPGIVVFGVGPHSLQIPNHYTNYAGTPHQPNKIIPGPAHARPTTVITNTATRIQPNIPKVRQPVLQQQNTEQTRHLYKPIQQAYPVQSPQYGNKLPVAQPQNYQQPIAPVAAVPAPIPVVKLPESIPTYVAPAKSTVYGSAYVDNSASYPALDSYTTGESSKPLGYIPAPYQSPAKQTQANYQATLSTFSSSKPTAIYIETKAAQPTESYAKQTTQIKESLPYYSTPSPKVKYVTDVPYSTPESKPSSDSYGKLSTSEKSKADKLQSKNPVDQVSQSYKEVESQSYGEKKKDIDSSKQNTYKGSTQEESKVKIPVYLASQSHKKVEPQEEKKEKVPVYVPNHPEGYQQTSVPAAAVPAPIIVNNLPESTPTYVAPTKSTVHASGYVANQENYSESDADSYTRGETSKPAGSSTASYQPSTKQPQEENYRTTPSTVYSSKPTENYKEIKTEQSTEAYTKKTTLVKETQSYYSTKSPQTKYSTHVPFSIHESKPASDSYGKLSPSEKSNVDKHQSNNPVSQSYEKLESLPYGEEKKEVDSPNLPYSKVEAMPAIQSSKQTAYKESTPEDSKVKVPVYPPSQSHKKVELQEEKKEQVQVYVPNHPEEYKKLSAPVAAVPTPNTVTKLPEIPSIYVTSANSAVQASAYVDKPISYPASDSYPRGEASKPAGSTPASYQSPVKQPQESYLTTTSALYSSKPTESYKETEAEQSTETYAKQTTQIKGSQSYYPTPSPKVQYSTDVTYSTPESKPSSDSYGKLMSHPEKSNDDKYQSKNPVYPASQTYKEVDSLSYGEKKKEVGSPSLPYSEVEAKPSGQSYTQKSYKESMQEESKLKAPIYPTSQSYKKVESLEEKKYQVPVYLPNRPLSKSDPTIGGESYQANPQTEKTNAYSNKPQAPVYPTTQSYRQVESLPYSEEKKELGVSNIPYSVVEAKPVIEAPKQNSYQQSTEGKVNGPLYPVSQGYKEVESPKDAQNYKKQDHAVYEPKYVGETSVKNSNLESYVEESQPKKSIGPIPDNYKKVESPPKSEDKRQHYDPKHVPSKAASVPAHQMYPSISAVTEETLKYRETNSKTYESKYPSVSPAPKVPVKEVNSYSKPTSVESNGYTLPAYSTTTSFPSYQYSTGSTTTRKSSIPVQDNSKVYYETTPKYQEPSTSKLVVTQSYPVYKSTAAYESIPVATTYSRKEDDYSQDSTKKNANMKANAPVAVETSYSSQTTKVTSNLNANDRVYVVADQDEIIESYHKKEPSAAYQSRDQSYSNPSVTEKLSPIKQVVNQYTSTDRDYSIASSGPASKSNYEGRPAASPVAELPTYNRKPIKEADTLTTSVEATKNSGIYRPDGAEGSYSAIPGKPEIDYPIFSELPNDKFNCSEQRLPGYYADTSARCQVFHICLGDRQWSFLCPNGTIFSQQHFVCVWWYEFDCAKAPGLYDLNEKLFIIPSTQQDPDHKSDQYAKPLASESLEETGKRYETFRNKEETISGAY